MSEYIPIDNVNCKHCKLVVKCDYHRTYPATGKPCKAEDFYCVELFRDNYSKEEVQVKQSREE